MDNPAVARTVALDQPDPAATIRHHANEGVDRIIEVSFSDNIDLDAAVVKNNAVVAAYATRQDRTDFPFWPMLFDNVTIRLFGSDDPRLTTGLIPATASGSSSPCLTEPGIVVPACV